MAKPATKRTRKPPTIKRAEPKEATGLAPTIGRIVHFFDHSLPGDGHNGGMHGPYAAIVAAVSSDGETVSLAVMPPGRPVFSVGPVAFRETPADAEPDAHNPAGAYWTWPPRA